MSLATSDDGSQTFNKKTVVWGVLASLLAAAGFFLLATYAPDFRLGGNGGATPLSKSGVGYAGVAKLLELNERPAIMGRGPVDELSSDESLMIITISPEANADLFGELIDAREGMPTLFVLPKWQTVPMPNHEGWEKRVAKLSQGEVNRWLAQIGEFKLAGDSKSSGDLNVDGITIKAPEEIQTIESPTGLISAGANKAVLIELQDRGFYVLADPDLINNQALKDPVRAEAALKLLDFLIWDDQDITFDLILHGAGRKHDMFKLLIEPPFLALTLSVLAAAALAFLHGLGRFGPARPDERAIPFGKRALVNTTANLLKRAGRLDRIGGRYASLMRSRAGALLGAPHGLQGDDLDQWLESRNKEEIDRYSGLAQATRTARTEADMKVAARRLHQWIARRIGESR